MKLRTKLPLFTSVTVLTSILLIAFTSIYNFRMQAEKDKAKRIMAYAKEMEGKLYNQHSNDESDIRKSDS